MRNKTISLLSAALTTLLLTGCISSPKLKRVDDVSAKEAIVVTKFRVLYNDQDITPGCNVIFNNRQQFILDASGYVFAKLPLGKNSIRNLIHKSGLMQHHFGKEELSCELVGGGVINYLGDVTFDWHGMSAGSGFGITAAFGVLGSSFMTGGKAVVTVATNMPAAQEAFQKRFSTDRTLTPALLVVKLHPEPKAAAAKP